MTNKELCEIDGPRTGLLIADEEDAPSSGDGCDVGQPEPVSTIRVQPQNVHAIFGGILAGHFPGMSYGPGGERR